MRHIVIIPLLKGILLSFVLLFSTNIYSEENDLSDETEKLWLEDEDTEENDEMDVDTTETFEKNNANTKLDLEEARNYVSNHYVNYGPGNKMILEEESDSWDLSFLDLGNFQTEPIYWILAFSFVFLIVVFIAISIDKMRRNHSQKVYQEIAEKEGVSLTISGEVERYIKEKNYKEAIRVLYVRTLIWLNRKKMIQWEKSKTPTEYYYELTSSSRKKDFLLLTRIFLTARYDNAEVDLSMVEQALECSKSIMKSNNGK